MLNPATYEVRAKPEQDSLDLAFILGRYCPMSHAFSA